MVKQLLTAIFIILFFLFGYCLATRDVFGHKLDMVQIIFSSQIGIEKRFVLKIENITKIRQYNFWVKEKYINDINSIECKEITLKSPNLNISKILLPKIKLCLNKDGNIYQKFIDNKYQLSNNTPLDEFATSGFLQFFNYDKRIIDGWCYQKFSKEYILHQEREVVEINCSGLYDTNLTNKELEDKKIIRQNSKYAEGIGLYNITKEYFDENNKTTQKIIINLQALAPQ